MQVPKTCLGWFVQVPKTCLGWFVQVPGDLNGARGNSYPRRLCILRSEKSIIYFSREKAESMIKGNKNR